MLTSDLIRPRLRLRGNTVSVALVDLDDPTLLGMAQELIFLFEQQRGQPRIAWEEALDEYEGTRTDYILIRGLAKVLADGAEFTQIETGKPPSVIREQMFSYGPVFRERDLLHTTTRTEVLQRIANDLEMPLEHLDNWMFADRPNAYLLTNAGGDWTPRSLLTRYNLELSRGVLYWASEITIEAGSDYKDLWKYIKLFKLMFWAEPLPDGGYRIKLDGPISPFVSASLRYGRQLAGFLPALLLCKRWRMQALVYPPQGRGEMIYELDHSSALTSHFKRSGEFDSRLEADFAREFAQKLGEKRQYWQLQRESEVVLLDDTVMVPDFALVDSEDQQRKILIELVGFWHPNYLRRKIEKVRAANCAHLLLLVYRGLNVTEEAFQDTASEIIFFQQKPVIKDVIETVEGMAQRLYGPRPDKKRTRRRQ